MNAEMEEKVNRKARDTFDYFLRKGITLCEDDGLILASPVENMTPEDWAWVRCYYDEFLAFLAEESQ